MAWRVVLPVGEARKLPMLGRLLLGQSQGCRWVVTCGIYCTQSVDKKTVIWSMLWSTIQHILVCLFSQSFLIHSVLHQQRKTQNVLAMILFKFCCITNRIQHKTTNYYLNFGYISMPPMLILRSCKKPLIIMSFRENMRWVSNYTPIKTSGFCFESKYVMTEPTRSDYHTYT